MSMHGGSREGAGRPKNAKNKATQDIKALAQEYGQEAIESLAEIMRTPDMPTAARVSAAKELLDRGYGKSVQTTDLTSSDGSMSPGGYAVTPEQAKTMEAWTQQVSAASQLSPEE